MKHVVVIGGGAAGMMAAIFAANKGARVTVLERNEKLGKKLYITGKGRCNVTNACDMDTFIQNVTRNGRFLYSALSFFSPDNMMAFLEKAGCPVVTERGRRVFPKSQKASDVNRALKGEMDRAGVQARLNTRAESLIIEEGAIKGVRLVSGETLPADRVIIATGGRSYPMTGSTGDGYKLFEAAGHTIEETFPALSALRTVEGWPKALQGLSLKNVMLTLQLNKKKVYSELGEMLFTHFGVSGPLVIEASSHLRANQLAEYELLLDLKPALSPEQVAARLLREFDQAPNKQLKNVLVSLLPGKMAAVFPAILGFDDSLPIHSVTKELRGQMAQGLKALPMRIEGFCAIAEAIITRGGVQVKEINAATMESKLVSGLYAAGEVLDVDAYTGGYNLQIAFSTGALAGENAAN